MLEYRMKFLFICDNKENWDVTVNMIKSMSVQNSVVCVLSKQTAIDQIMNDGDIHCFVIDADMKDENPRELAEALWEMTGQKPVIFIGTDHLLEIRVMGDLYIENELEMLVKRPLELKDLSIAVTKAKLWNEKESFENSVVEEVAENFSPIKIRNFYYYDSFSYDVYFKVTEKTFSKVLQKNQTFPQSLVEKFIKKRVKYFYLYKEDKLKFLEDSIHRLKNDLVLTNETDPRKLLSDQVSCSGIIMEYLRSMGISESVQEITDILIKSIRDAAIQYKSLSYLCSLFPKQRDFTEAKAILCMYFSEFISHDLGWKSPMIRNKLALASLLHDSTLSDEEMSKIRTLEDPRYLKLRDDQQLEYKEHPRRAAELVSLFSGYPETDFIILQHHELPDGSGFPKGLNATSLQPISATFILICNFCADLYSTNMAGGKYSALVKLYSKSYEHGNFRDPLKKLSKLF